MNTPRNSLGRVDIDRNDHLTAGLTWRPWKRGWTLPLSRVSQRHLATLTDGSLFFGRSLCLDLKYGFKEQRWEAAGQLLPKPAQPWL